MIDSRHITGQAWLASAGDSAVNGRLMVALAAVASVGFGTNLTIQLINLGMQSRGVNTALIGFSTMMQAVGIVAAAPLAASLMRHIGIRRTMATGAMIAAAAMLTLLYTQDFLQLTLLRMFYASGLALVFTCAEFVMLASAARETRGLSAGVYSTVLGLGMTAGPICISLFGSASHIPAWFAVAACVMCIPAVMAGMPPSCPPNERRRHWRLTLKGVSPLALMAAFTFGFLDNGPVSFLSVYSIKSGWSEPVAVALVSSVTIGAILCQAPIGWSVDRYQARHVYAAGGVLAFVALILLPHVWFAPPAVLICAITLGAVMEGLYTVGLADLGKRDDGANLSGANACFVMVCGLGEIVGPALTGWII